MEKTSPAPIKYSFSPVSSPCLGFYFIENGGGVSILFTTAHSSAKSLNSTFLFSPFPPLKEEKKLSIATSLIMKEIGKDKDRKVRLPVYRRHFTG